MNKDCEYEISGIKYSGCQFDVDSVNDNSDWTQYITVSNFGQMPLTQAAQIKLTLYLMNPWTAYAFGQRNISAIQYNSMNQQVARGEVLLNSIYPNATSFTAVTLSNYNFV